MRIVAGEGAKKSSKRRNIRTSLGHDAYDRVARGHRAAGARRSRLGRVEHEQGPDVALGHLFIGFSVGGRASARGKETGKIETSWLEKTKASKKKCPDEKTSPFDSLSHLADRLDHVVVLGAPEPRASVGALRGERG